MTAINDLVERAGIDASLTALYDVALAMAGVLPEVFRVEFRMPTESGDVKEEPEPVIVNQVDVYALAREMAAVLGDIVVPEKTAPAIPPQNAADPRAPAATSIHEVTRELRERVEKLEKETISLPAVYSNFYSTGVIPANAPAVSIPAGGLATPSHDVPQSPDEVTPATRDFTEKRVEREVIEKAVRKSSIESTEYNIKQSASVVRELEEAYERLATSTVDVDKEIKRSATVEIDKVRIFTGEPPEQKGAAETVTDPEEKGIPIAPARSVEVPAFKLTLKVSPPSEQAADNARMLSEATAKSSIAMPAAGIEQERMAAERPPAREGQTAVPRIIAPPALVSVHRSLRIMNEYLSSAAAVSGPQIFGGLAVDHTPLVEHLLDTAAPSGATVNMLVQAGEAVRIPVPRPLLIRANDGPAMNLAVSVAAAREPPEGRAMANLIRDAGTAFVLSPERGTAPAPGVTENNATSKVSNFHNTFNITVTVKGGGSGEDGDLRELGRKIGRILSDEIKRYGGI